MSLIDCLLQVLPVDGNEPYSSTGSIDVVISVLPPGVSIVLSLPPFAVILDASQALELAALLGELAALVP